MPSFTTPFETLVEHCKEHGIKCHIDHDKKFINFSMCGDAAVYRVRWGVTHEDEVLQMDITVPVHARDEKMRPLVVETLMRANHRLVLGNFNLDHSDGEIVYHIASPIGEAGLEDLVICKLFGTALATTDRYFTALMRLMYGGHTPEDAVYLADLDSHCERVSKDENATAPKPSAKKSGRAPGKKKQPPKSAGASGPTPDLFNPPAGEGSDRPPRNL